jgi:hypothetical protein
LQTYGAHADISQITHKQWMTAVIGVAVIYALPPTVYGTM